MAGESEPYEPVLSPRAVRQVNALDADLREFVIEHLQYLAASPVALSYPSPTPPYPPGFQVYEFNGVFHNELHYFAVLFKYAANERDLLIHGIGHMRQPLPDDE